MFSVVLIVNKMQRMGIDSMEYVVSYFNDNWKIYLFFVLVMLMVGFYWLSKYFVIKIELVVYVNSQEECLKLNELKFKDYQIEYYKLCDKVYEIDSYVKYFFSVGESVVFREEIVCLNG